MEYIQLIGGMVLLIVGGNYLIDSAVDIARKFKLSPLIIGLTIVAFGTSAPELVVSAKAAWTGHPEIALGNVVGSNIVNIGLILALTVIILPLTVERNSIKVDGPFMLLVSLLLVFAAWNGYISRCQGIIGVLILTAFTVWSVRVNMKKNRDEAVAFNPPRKHIVLNVLLLLVSCVGLTYGADFLVKGASTIATNLGLSERVISIVIVGFGTSLPEFTASIIAAIKKEEGMSLGNIIGSNIFNILGVLGITAIIAPIRFTAADFHPDLICMIIVAALLLLGMYRGRLTRAWGIVTLLLYIGYIVSLFVQ